MDRIDAMKVFVAAVDEGSLAGAGRRSSDRPRRSAAPSPSSKHHVGTELLHRTTRSLKLSEAGERYAAACRRVLIDLEEADILAAGERSAPRGTLTVTAPVIAGEDVLRPLLEAFMNEYPMVAVRLYLLDRQVNLIDEGIDVALRIAHLADSSFVAIRLGEVRRVIAASPGYLAQHPDHQRTGRSGEAPDHCDDAFRTRLLEFSAARRLVRSASRAVRPAAGRQHGARGGRLGHGRTRRHAPVLLSYRRAKSGWTAADPAWRRMSIRHCLRHLVAPQGRFSVPKVRAFADFAVPRLKRYFAQLSTEATRNDAAIRSHRGRLPAE